MSTLPSFKDMPLWQHATQLAVEICRLASDLPAAERLTIGSNLQDAALAIPVALARGSKAGKRGFRDALLSSRQTAAEIETLLLIAEQLFGEATFAGLAERTVELHNGLTIMARRLAAPDKPTPTV